MCRVKVPVSSRDIFTRDCMRKSSLSTWDAMTLRNCVLLSPGSSRLCKISVNILRFATGVLT